MENPISRSILFLLCVPTLVQLAYGLDIVQHSCKLAAKTDPYVDYKLCVQTLKASPNSKDAEFKDLVVISINQSKANATEIGSEISELMKRRSEKWGQYSLNCLKSCLELYSEAVSDLEKALKGLKMEDYETAKTGVSAAMDAPVSCEDGYKEKDGEVSPLSEINDGFFQLVAISLAFINMC